MLHSASDDYPLTGTGTQHKPAGSARRTGNTRADPIFTHSSSLPDSDRREPVGPKNVFLIYSLQTRAEQYANVRGVGSCRYLIQRSSECERFACKLGEGPRAEGLSEQLTVVGVRLPTPRPDRRRDTKTGRQLAAAAAPHAAAATPATIRPNTITENTLGVRQGKTFVD